MPLFLHKNLYSNLAQYDANNGMLGYPWILGKLELELGSTCLP